MSSSLPEAWFVGGNQVGKRLCIQALVNKDLDHSGKGVWDIETKYYHAQVAVKPISSKDTAPSSSNTCEALVLICDASRESTYHEALDWLKSIAVDPEIRLLVINKMDLINGGSIRRPVWLEAALQWSIDECFEYIEVCACNPSIDQQLTLDGEQQGMARVADALKAHMWPGLEHRTHRLKTDYVAPTTSSVDEQNDVCDASGTPDLDSSPGADSAGADTAGASINGVVAADRSDNTETNVDGAAAEINVNGAAAETNGNGAAAETNSNGAAAETNINGAAVAAAAAAAVVMETLNDAPIATGMSTDVHDSSAAPKLGAAVVPSEGDDPASLAIEQAASSSTLPTVESKSPTLESRSPKVESRSPKVEFRSPKVESRISEQEQDVDAVGNSEGNSVSISSDATHAVSQQSQVTGASSNGVSGSGCSGDGRQARADAEAGLQEHEAEYSGNDLAADKDQEDGDLEAGLEEFEKLLVEVQGARHNLSRLSDEDRRTEASRLAIRMAQLLGIDELSDDD